MTAPADWIPHRRADGELVGWIRPDGDAFVPIDLLGREVTGPVEWLAAEEILEAAGIGYLAEPYAYRLGDGRWVRVRITEASTDAIRVKQEDWGAVGAAPVQYTARFPLSEDELRPHTPDGTLDVFVDGV